MEERAFQRLKYLMGCIGVFDKIKFVSELLLSSINLSRDKR